MGKTINSLKNLGAAMGMKVKTREVQEKALKCCNCGADMEHIAGTNVYVCHGSKIIQDAEGNEKTIACTNTFLRKN